MDPGRLDILSIKDSSNPLEAVSNLKLAADRDF